MIVNLPWPNRNLSPNARVHWRTRARAVASDRHIAATLCRAAGVKKSDEPMSARFTLHKPNPLIDSDNAIASNKAFLDGVADALGVNDRKIAVTWAFGEPVKNGAVVVEIAARTPREHAKSVAISDVSGVSLRGAGSAGRPTPHLNTTLSREDKRHAHRG